MAWSSWSILSWNIVLPSSCSLGLAAWAFRLPIPTLASPYSLPTLSWALSQRLLSIPFIESLISFILLNSTKVVLLSQWTRHSFKRVALPLQSERPNHLGQACPRSPLNEGGLERTDLQSSEVSVCTNCLWGVLLTEARQGHTCSLVTLGKAGPEVAVIINPVAIAAVSVHLPLCDLEQ